MVAKGLQGSPPAKRVDHPTDRDQHNETLLCTIAQLQEFLQATS